MDFTQTEIARQIGVNKSTISRELKRNTGLRGYRPKQAHKKAVERRKLASKAVKMTKALIEIVEEKLSQQQWSPEQISAWLLKDKSIAMSVMSAFISIYGMTKKQGGDLYTSI